MTEQNPHNPRTNAGWRLLGEEWENYDGTPWGSIADHILAIEAEAVAVERESVRALVKAARRLAKVMDLASSIHTPERRAARFAFRAALAAWEDSPKGSDARARELPGLGGERE